MRKLNINVDQLIELLDQMRESGTETISLFEHNGLPAICDADDEENYIIFSTGDDEGLH